MNQPCGSIRMSLLARNAFSEHGDSLHCRFVCVDSNEIKIESKIYTHFWISKSVQVFVFEFVNSFLAMFYSAFIKVPAAESIPGTVSTLTAGSAKPTTCGDDGASSGTIPDLEMRLGTLFITRIVVSNFLEAGVPVLTRVASNYARARLESSKGPGADQSVDKAAVLGSGARLGVEKDAASEGGTVAAEAGGGSEPTPKACILLMGRQRRFLWRHL